MGSLRSVLVSLTVLAVAGAAATPAQAARDRCKKGKARNVKVTKKLRITATAGGSTRVCLRRSGRTTLLFRGDDLYTSGRIRRTAGRFVAYETTHIPECKADCPPDVNTSQVTTVIDAKSRERRSLHDGPLTTLILRPSGSVAWVFGQAPDVDLNTWTAELRHRATGDISDVHREGRELVWMQSGLRRTTPLP